MDQDVGELLFYGGLIVAAGALLVAIVLLCVYKVKSTRLKAQFDREYGSKAK
jgi:hypothetical protein